LVRKVILLIISPLSNKENTKKRKKERKKEKEKERKHLERLFRLTTAQYLGLCVCCPTWRDFLCQFNSNSFLKMN